MVLHSLEASSLDLEDFWQAAVNRYLRRDVKKLNTGRKSLQKKKGKHPEPPNSNMSRVFVYLDDWCRCVEVYTFLSDIKTDLRLNLSLRLSLPNGFMLVR